MRRCTCEIQADWLMRAIDDPEAIVRLEAVRASTGTVVAAQILEVATFDAVVEIRVEALQSIARSNEPNLVAIAERAVIDDHWLVRMAAIKALARLRPELTRGQLVAKMARSGAAERTFARALLLSRRVGRRP